MTPTWSRLTRRSVLIGSVSVFVAGCSGTPQSTSTGGSGSATTGGVTTAWPADITTLYPPDTANPQDGQIGNSIYQSLAAYTFEKNEDGSYVQQGSELSPSLAESWDVDGDTVTWHLRTDTTFYPSGNPVTADDVKWSAAAWLAGPNAQDLTTNGFQSADDVEVIDDHTVSFQFKTDKGKSLPVTTTVLAAYTGGHHMIMDSVEAKKHATASDEFASQWLRENSAGTGPYYVKSRKSGEEIILAPVPKADPKPSVDQVTIRIVNNASVSGLLQSGDINLAEYNLSQNDLNQLRTNGFTVASEVTQQFSYLALPTDTGPFTDVRVRQAIAHAIPYQQIVDSVYFGRAKRGLSTVPVTSSAYTPAWEKYDTNLGKATSLMQEAGSPKISLPLHYGNADVTQEDMAILIKENLAKIGIDVALTPHTSAELWDVVNARSKAEKGQAAAPEIVQFLWSAWIDDPKIPIGYETTTGGVNNYSLYSDAEVDKINAEWQFAPASADRDAAYQRAQEVVAADLPVVPITFAERAVVLGKGLQAPSFPVSGGVRLFLLEPAS